MSARKIRNSWWVDFRCGNVRCRKRSPENSRAGAQAYEASLRQKLARGESLDVAKPSDPTFQEFVPQWMDTYVKTNNKPTEQRSKEVSLRLYLLPWFGTKKLSAITTLEIERYKSDTQKRGLSPKTINNQLGTLLKCLRSANEWGLLAVVPRSSLLHVPPQRFDFLTPLESSRLLGDREEPQWHEMILVALRTGMRLGELFGLDWSAIDFEQGRISVVQAIVYGRVSSPKNNRMRHLPATEEVLSALRYRRRESGLVFPRPDGEPLAYNTADLAIKRHCARTGLRPIGWHTLRHTFASQLATSGTPMRAIQDLLGHSTVQMTARYAHMAPSSLRGYVEALRAGELHAASRFGQQVGNNEKLLATMLE